MGEWRISDAAQDLVREGLAHYVTRVGAPDFPYCATLLSGEGGEMRFADGTRQSTPPRYGLSIIAIRDIEEQGFVAIELAGGGVMGFEPRHCGALAGEMRGQHEPRVEIH
jgi:hypothetical protein